MENSFEKLINNLRSEGRDYTQFKSLLESINVSGVDVSKENFLDFVTKDSRIQLHATPNSIASLISFLAQKYRPHSAIDLCCGTGNILYYLQNEIDDLTGVELDENVAILSKYFLPDLHIITADSFQYPFSRRYDLVVGNVPFGMPIELDNKRMLIEEAFVEKAHDLLTENGQAIMLLPYSMLISSSYNNFRKKFVSYVSEIITIPSGIIRNSYMNTFILVISKQMRNELRISRLYNYSNLESEYLGTSQIFVPKDKLAERWISEYSVGDVNGLYNELGEFQTKELHELAEVFKGRTIPKFSLKDQGDFLYLRPTNIQKSSLIPELSSKFVLKSDLNESMYKYILQPGDIVLSMVFNEVKTYLYKVGDYPSFVSSSLAIIRSSKHDYIFSFLQTKEGQRIFKFQADDLMVGVAIPYFSIKDLSKIRVPVFPISNLNQLSDYSICNSSRQELFNQRELLSSYRILPNVSNFSKNLISESSSIYDIKFPPENVIGIDFLSDRLLKIEEELKHINQKLDRLLDLVKDLKSEFTQIQKLPRDEEEKLFKLYQKIDAKLDTFFNKETQTIQEYIESVKRWLDLWDNLDVQSQKYLPIAELIFDELSRLNDADYAPFVLQYCRTLENEILKKLFEAYHEVGLIDVDTVNLIQDDLKDNKTGKFANMVKHNKITYTLGEMNHIMAMLKEGGNTLKNSSLLQHFRIFTISFFDEQIVEADFLNDLNKITNDFRNKAAHPYSISIEMAKDCQVLLRKSLNIFLESFK